MVATGRDGFATTRWSVVAAAGGDADERRAALAVLCETYWYPIYAFARRHERAAEDALDLAQGFFAHLLEGADVARADASRGRFRAYLLGAFKHWLSNERDRARAKKRGGDALVLDGEDAERRFRAEAAEGDDPERAFERSWARSLLERVLATLRAEYEAGDKGELFERLKPALSGDAVPYAELARELETNEGALRVAVHRLRRRFGECLRHEIAHTLEDPTEVDEELHGLFEALA